MNFEIVNDTIIVTAFTFVMMILVEYLNVVTKGTLPKLLHGKSWRQYVIACFIGAVPGCVGGFTNVTLYCHRLISFGAIVGGMIASSGDEAFVMLALFPGKAIVLFGVLLVIGIGMGILTDKLVQNHMLPQPYACEELELHPEEYDFSFSLKTIFQELGQGFWKRITLITGLIVIIVVSSLGILGEPEWNVEKIVFISVMMAGLLMLISASSHFFESHLWKHIIKEHLPRIFFWTLGALIVIDVLVNYLNLESWLQKSHLLVLLAAVLIGIIPESGPHLLFVTLFFKEAIPFSILLASSIVQDGHGMIPMLAYSPRDFIYIKILNFIIGLTIGLIGYFMGW